MTQKIEATGKYLAMTDNGMVQLPIFTATAHNGERVEFKDYKAASWWLKLDDNHVEWVKRRKGLQDTGLI